MASDFAFSSDASADGILAAVRAAYASCRTYRDRGEVVITFFTPVQLVIHRPFSTSFDRSSNGFRFEFRNCRGEEHWDQMVVWNDCIGATVRPRRWWSPRPSEEPIDTLADGISAATGVSGGSSRRVPALLMPDLFNGEAPHGVPTGANVIDDPEAIAQGCAVVSVPHGVGAVKLIWIDRVTCLIRRVVVPRYELERAFPEAIARARARRGTSHKEPTEVEEVTTYHEATFDAPIPIEDLQFVPPTS